MWKLASWKIYRLFSEEDVGPSRHIKVIDDINRHFLSFAGLIEKKEVP